MTILTEKELEVHHRPLLLAEMQFWGGSVLRVATDRVEYNGAVYEPRLHQQSIAGIQLLSEQGIDLVPSVTLSLADPDGAIWHQWERAIGFKGARLTLRLVLVDLATGECSGDGRVVFAGVCNAPEAREDALVVWATSRLGMARVELPVLRIQRQCPWVFPRTAEERQAAAEDERSEFYRCGYSPDIASTNARGNFNNYGEPFSLCGYTFDDCLARMGS